MEGDICRNNSDVIQCSWGERSDEFDGYTGEVLCQRDIQLENESTSKSQVTEGQGERTPRREKTKDKALRQETSGFTQSEAGREEEKWGDRRKCGKGGRHFLSTVEIH